MGEKLWRGRSLMDFSEHELEVVRRICHETMQKFPKDKKLQKRMAGMINETYAATKKKKDRLESAEQIRAKVVVKEVKRLFTTKDANDMIDDFLDYRIANNRWVARNPINVYLRRASHFVGASVQPTIDISSVTVAERYRRQGVFKTFLTALEERGVIVYIENVYNNDLAAFLVARGYTKAGQSYYKDFRKRTHPCHRY